MNLLESDLPTVLAFLICSSIERSNMKTPFASAHNRKREPGIKAGQKKEGDIQWVCVLVA